MAKSLPMCGGRAALASVVALVSACVVPALDAGSQDTLPADDVETDLPDTDALDTDAPDTPDEPDDTDALDTGLPTTGGGGGGGGGGGQIGNLGCHGYNPVETAGAWKRVYDITTDAGSGTETQTGVGLTGVPNTVGGGITQGFGVDSVISGNGVSNTNGRSWYVCDLASGAFFEVAWRQDPQGFQFPDPGTLRAGARQPRPLLPAEIALVNGFPSDSGTTVYDLDTIGSTIPTTGSPILRVQWSYIGFGTDPVTVPAGTFNDAYRMIYTLDQTQTSQSGGIMDLFFAPFQIILSDLLGFEGSDASAIIERQVWYVRGIGPVKETTTRIDAGSPTGTVSTKELRSCKRLPHSACQP